MNGVVSISAHACGTPHGYLQRAPELPEVALDCDQGNAPNDDVTSPLNYLVDAYAMHS
jgi:hypothetical protein